MKADQRAAAKDPRIRNCRKPDLRREKEELLQDKHKKWWFVEIW
ncbi:hypothetical protein CV83915_2p0261 (plasmid) [Escherichia coli]|uniref:Uncharacterized protein n=1 Tax=Escherichia coli TaxID=562 RepID=A0A2H4TL71_ECOLX|nr:hypothetical protein CV83915_2p0261 [Escherichia coli]